MRLEILLTLAFFFTGTCLSGYAVRHVLKLKNEGVLFSIMSGIMFWWALMELILVPMTMFRGSFQAFVMVYSFVQWASAVEKRSLQICGCWQKRSRNI